MGTVNRDSGSNNSSSRRRPACLSNLAAALAELGEYERARQLDEDILARRRRVLGEDHPETLASANNLATDVRSSGDDEIVQSYSSRPAIMPDDCRPAMPQAAAVDDQFGTHSCTSTVCPTSPSTDATTRAEALRNLVARTDECG